MFLILFVITFTMFVFAVDNELVTLAVNDLSAQGVKESDAVVISEQLRSELMRSRKLQLVERSQMQQILKEQGFQQSGCTSDACAVEMGQLIGVKNVVVGSVGAAGSYTLLSVRVIDVRTGNIIVNETVRTKGGIDKVIEEGIAEASTKLLNGLVMDSGTKETETPVTKETETKVTKETDTKVTKETETKVTRKKPLRGVLIGTGVAVLAGGGVAAVLFLKNDNKNKESVSTPNTTVIFP